METFLEMDFDEWFDTYKPIPNNIDKNASFDGHMFETYGDEVEFVKKAHPNHVWMYGDGDDGGSFVWSGWGFVNRLGYFITELPWPEGVTIQVMVDEPDLTCQACDDIIEEDEKHQCEEIE
jgi:hypothetical protein